jgi:hypothetical protein
MSSGLALSKGVDPNPVFVRTKNASIRLWPLPKIRSPFSRLVSPSAKDQAGEVATQNLNSPNSNDNSADSPSPAPKRAFSPSSQRSHPSAQESLQQLDESLQRIGIDPQRVSLIRRVEAVNLADDPLALEQYFQSPAAPLTHPNQQAPASSYYVSQANPATQPTRLPKATKANTISCPSAGIS